MKSIIVMGIGRAKAVLELGVEIPAKLSAPIVVVINMPG